MARIVGENNERNEREGQHVEADSDPTDPLFTLWREVEQERGHRSRRKQDQEAAIPTDISGQVDTSSGDMYHGIDDDDIDGGLTHDINAIRTSEDDPTP